MQTVEPVFPVFLLVVCVTGLAVVLLVLGRLLNPRRPTAVKRMPYESGMDPVHDTRRRFDVQFHLLAIAFLVFDVELLFLYPWAVVAAPARVAAAPEAVGERLQVTRDRGQGERSRGGFNSPVSNPESRVPSPESRTASPALPNRRVVFSGVMVFIALLGLGFIYDWRKGIFAWR